MAGFFYKISEVIKKIIFKIILMKRVVILLGALTLAAVIIQQIIGETGSEEILTREDDPTIPPVSAAAF
jgi:hypothetical protein